MSEPLGCDRATQPVQALDGELAAIVATLRSRGIVDTFGAPLADVRRRMAQSVAAARQVTARPVVRSVSDQVASFGGHQVPVRVYQPLQQGPHPTVVFFHGGGFMLGSIDLMDDLARKLCRDAGVTIVSADYRLAPEHVYPAAHDDALAATLWAVEHAAALGGDGRVGVFGESAGANLAASIAITLRDRNIRLAAQMLVSPGLDVARDVSLIAVPPGDFPLLTCRDLVVTSRTYMGDRLSDAADCPPSPLRAADLKGLPRTVLAVAGHDPLRDEGLAYAHRLREAGVSVQALRFDDMFHPFLGFFAASRSACHANDLLCRALGDLFLV